MDEGLEKLKTMGHIPALHNNSKKWLMPLGKVFKPFYIKDAGSEKVLFSLEICMLQAGVYDNVGTGYVLLQQ